MTVQQIVEAREQKRISSLEGCRIVVHGRRTRELPIYHIGIKVPRQARWRTACEDQEGAAMDPMSPSEMRVWLSCRTCMAMMGRE